MDNHRFAQSLEACLCAEIVDRVESGNGLRGSASRRHSARNGVSLSSSGHTAGESPSHNNRVQQKLFVDTHLSEDELEGGEDAREDTGNKEISTVKNLLSDVSPFIRKNVCCPVRHPYPSPLLRG